MFEIDLKSTAARPTRPEAAAALAPEVAASLLPVILTVAGVAALLWFTGRWLDGRIADRRAAVTKLESAIDGGRKELAEISGKRRALYATQREEIYWSDELRLLSEKLPDKMWLTQVKVVSAGGGEKNLPVSRTLSIEGGVLSNPSEGNLDLIGKFIQDLQADRRFQQAFSNATLESVKRASGEPYALLFQLKIDFS